MSHGFLNYLSSFLDQNLQYQQPASDTFRSQNFRPFKHSYQTDIFDQQLYSSNINHEPVSDVENQYTGGKNASGSATTY